MEFNEPLIKPDETSEVKNFPESKQSTFRQKIAVIKQTSVFPSIGQREV